MSHQAAIAVLFSFQWLTSPEAGLVIGVLGLLGTLFGFFLSYRAEKKLAKNLSDERERIIKGVADVISALSPALIPANAIPKSGEPAASSGALSPSSEPNRPAGADRKGASPQARPGEYVGTIDVTGDGDPDLLVEQIQQGKASMKIFAWQEFDLVLVAELHNATGAHFHPRDDSSIATLDWLEGKLVERIFTWHREKIRERVNTEPEDVEIFRQAPEWSI